MNPMGFLGVQTMVGSAQGKFLNACVLCASSPSSDSHQHTNPCGLSTLQYLQDPVQPFIETLDQDNSPKEDSWDRVSIVSIISCRDPD